MDPYEKWEEFERRLFRMGRRRLTYQVLMLIMGGVMFATMFFIDVNPGAGWVVLLSGLLMAVGSFGWSYYNQQIHTMLQARFNEPRHYDYHIDDIH